MFKFFYLIPFIYTAHDHNNMVWNTNSTYNGNKT